MMYLGFRGFHSTEAYSPSLEPCFPQLNYACKLHWARAAQRSVCFQHFPMRGLDAKIVFDPLNKSQTPDGERFRPAIIADRLRSY